LGGVSRRTVILILALGAGLAVAALLLVFARPGPHPQVAALEADPMAAWTPATVPVTESFRHTDPPGSPMGKPRYAKVFRTLQLTTGDVSPESLVDELCADAIASGWTPTSTRPEWCAAEKTFTVKGETFRSELHAGVATDYTRTPSDNVGGGSELEEIYVSLTLYPA
jgi:hypothetical protein